MRSIVLDTETTGLNAGLGDRIIELGCIEVLNRQVTGNHFHRYINPERDMPAEAFAVHGLSSEFLSSKPLFTEVVEEFLEFIGDAPLVAHNAEFDMRFLNAELALLKRTMISLDRAIDNTQRTLHGSLLDAQLRAEVYLQLLGGPQTGLSLSNNAAEEAARAALTIAGRVVRPARPHAASPAELAAHTAFVATLKDAVWLG